MKNYDINLHVKGQSLFVDDVSLPVGTLHAAVFTAPSAHGLVRQFELSEAMAMQGVENILTASDIPGHNQIGHVIHDEPLFAREEFEYLGQPLALVVAKDVNTARQAVKKIRLEFDRLPAVLDPREAFSNGQIIGKKRIFSCGNIDETWE